VLHVVRLFFRSLSKQEQRIDCCERGDFFLTGKSRLMSKIDQVEFCALCPKPVFALACWVPLGPWHIDGGSVALLPGSHRYSGFIKGPANAHSQTPAGFKNQVLFFRGLPTNHKYIELTFVVSV